MLSNEQIVENCRAFIAECAARSSLDPWEKAWFVEAHKLIATGGRHFCDGCAAEIVGIKHGKTLKDERGRRFCLAFCDECADQPYEEMLRGLDVQTEGGHA